MSVLKLKDAQGNITPILTIKGEKGDPYCAIGQIVESVLPLTDAGLHLLDGAKLPANGMYDEFCQYVRSLVPDNPNLFTDEERWQASVSSYGSCGKFVIANDGVRLPLITNIVQGTSNVGHLGDLVQAGLPSPVVDASHSHSLPNQLARYDGDINHTLTGGPSNIKTGEIWTRTSSNTNTTNLTLIATNSVYGNSETVQPQTIKVLLYICVANNTKSDVVVDIDRVATDLNGKLDRDLSNVIGNAVERVVSKAVASNGHVKLESGLQICWGNTGYTAGQITTVTFSSPFVNVMRVAINRMSSEANTDTNGNVVVCDVKPTYFKFVASHGANSTWIAVGI